MTPLDSTKLIFFAAMALAMIVWGFTCTWTCGKARGARLKDLPITSPSKERDMKTSDLSPAMIGQTIRIVRKGIAGTHNYIEGPLEDFSFGVSFTGAYGYSSVRREFNGLEATVAGLDFNLTGNEELVASPVAYE